MLTLPARPSTPRPRRRAVAVLAVIVGLGLAALPAPAHAVDTPGADADGITDTLTPSDTARVQPTVALPVQSVTSPGRGGLNGVTTVRVGRSAPMRVIIDTGFSGLLLFPGAWDRVPGGVSMTRTRGAVTAPDGSRLRGIRGSATMTFNGVTTAVPVPFLYSAATSAYARQWERLGVYGLMGVGTKGGGSLINPLTALPGNLGLRWSIHFDRPVAGRGGKRGQIVLGAQLPVEPVMSFQLKPNGQNANGALLWNDQAAAGCWRFGTRPEVCVDTWFDAAFNIMRVKGSAFRGVPQDRQGWVRSGTRVQVAAEGAAFVGSTFRAGSSPSRNKAKVIGSGSSLINTGNSYYFDYTISYDTVVGRLSLSAPTGKGALRP